MPQVSRDWSCRFPKQVNIASSWGTDGVRDVIFVLGTYVYFVLVIIIVYGTFIGFDDVVVVVQSGYGFGVIRQIDFGLNTAKSDYCEHKRLKH